MPQLQLPDQNQSYKVIINYLNIWFYQPKQDNDILAISSSEHQTSLWAQKQAFKQPYIAALLEPLSNPQHSSSFHNSTFFFADLKPKIIPKLLLPKASRPAMYSLNGYIPKPNMQRFTTTTTTKKPMTIRFKKFGVESKVKKPTIREKAIAKKKVSLVLFFH